MLRDTFDPVLVIPMLATSVCIANRNSDKAEALVFGEFT